MIILGMNDERETPDLEGVIGKLSMLSRVLGEVDDWLESKGPRDGPREPKPGARRLSLASLDLYLARERARS